MKFAQSLRRRLAELIAQDSRGDAPSAKRGRLLLEALENRQLMAGDVDLFATDGGVTTMEGPTNLSGFDASTATNRTPQGEPGMDLVQFAIDLDAALVRFYGANWCPACTEQKDLFEDGGKDLPFIEVTDGNRNLLPQFATTQIFDDPANPAFPRWIFPNGERRTGVLTLQEISTLSGVPIPQNTDEAPSFADIGDKTVRLGSPLHVPVDGYDPEGGPLTVTVSVADPSLLEAVVLTGNRSLRLDMVGYGDMVFELFEQRAPRTAGRIAALAESGFYDGNLFHRIDDGFVLQAGRPETGDAARQAEAAIQTDDEFHPDLQHTGEGVLSYAKAGDDTNSTQFFITETATQFLDFNHSVMGQLVEGFDVREAISGQATNAAEVPLNDVRINTATLFNDTENSVIMLKALAGSGSTSVTITMTDEDGNSFQEIIQVNLAPDTVNAQPYLNPITPPAPVTAGTPATLQLSSVDLEGDSVQYFLASPTTTGASATVNAATGLVTVTPNAGFTGTANFRVGVRATTGAGNATDEQLVPFVFSAASTSPAPTSIDLAAASDTGRSSTDNVTNSGSLTFNVAGVTSGATVEIINTVNAQVIGTGVASGNTIAITTNNLAALGDGTYTLAARQRVGGTTSTLSPTITVELDRIAPTINRNSFSTNGNINTLYTTDLVSPGEGVGAQYRLANGPAGASIVAGTGVISWTPTAAQEGANAFRVEIEDTAGNVRSEQFTLNVAGQPLAGVRLEVTDTDGNVINSVAVGQEFLLRMYGTDERSGVNVGGVFGAFADIVFDGTLVRAVPGTSIQYGVDFSLLRAGTLSTGLFNEIGANISRTVPTAEPESLIATVRMEALASGSVNFVSEPADEPDNDVLLFFGNEQIPASAVAYRSIPLAIGQSFTALADTFTVAEDSAATTLNVLANDTVISGTGTLSVVSVTQPATGGSVTLSGGEVRFTPASDFVGTVEFTYRVADTNGVQQSVPVTVNVTNVNDPPIGVDDAFTIPSGSVSQSLDVLANEADQAETGETLRISSVGTTSQGGTATVAADGLSINYTPPADFLGTETFDYVLTDGSATDTVRVTITVTTPDAPPTAVADSFPATGSPAINEDIAEASYDVLANDTRDADGQAFVISAVGTPSRGGTASIGGNGATLLYRPAANFNGVETVTYTIRDTGGGLSTTTATFTITAVNDPPPVQGITRTVLTSDGQQVILSISDLPANPDSGETIRFVNLSATTGGGTASVSTDGQQLLYTPSANFTGTDTFTFAVQDPGGLTSSVATATIEVVQFTRRSIDVMLASTILNVAESSYSLMLTGTDATGESVEIDLRNSSQVTTSTTGLRVNNLLPGRYMLNVPALPFFEGGEVARQIEVISDPDEGDETVEVAIGRLRSEYISVRDWYFGAPRQQVVAIVQAGQTSTLARAGLSSTGTLRNAAVQLDAAATSVTLRASRTPTAGGTASPVVGSASLSNGNLVQNRGVIGDTMLLVLNVGTGGIALSADTSPAATPAPATTPSGEPLSASAFSTASFVAGATAAQGESVSAVTVADVFVPPANPVVSQSLRQASGEPLTDEPQPAVATVNAVTPASSVDAAMTEVEERLTLISPAESVVAGAAARDAAAFSSSVDTVLTADGGVI